MTELQAFKEIGSKQSSEGTTNTNNATYQIYYRPEQAKFSKSARVSTF